MIQTFAQAYAGSVEALQELVAELQLQDILHSEHIWNALLETPREAFVPTFFIEKGNIHFVSHLRIMGDSLKSLHITLRNYFTIVCGLGGRLRSA